MALAYIEKGSLASIRGAITSIPDKIVLIKTLVKRSQHDREICEKHKPFHYHNGCKVLNTVFIRLTALGAY